MISEAPKMLSGDMDALGMLTRISALMGLGTVFTNTTHSGSMAEHMISHYIDMFAGDLHPQSSHGQQVGVGTITLSQLHNEVLNNDKPPLMQPTQIPEQALIERFGDDIAQNLIEQPRIKALDAAAADALNARFDEEWNTLREKLKSVMIPYDVLRNAMQAAGCQLTATDLGLDTNFYREAVQNARYIRDRFSMLDIVDDSVGLQGFVQNMPT